MRKIYAALPLALLLALCQTGCLRDEEAERTPDIDFYIQYASERSGVDAEDISIVEYQIGRTKKKHFLIWQQHIW